MQSIDDRPLILVHPAHADLSLPCALQDKQRQPVVIGQEAVALERPRLADLVRLAVEIRNACTTR